MKRTAPRPGDLKDTIRINDKIQAPDGYGGVIETPVLYWETYAEVRLLRSSNRLEANQETLKQVYRIACRYRPDKQVAKDMSVTWRGREFKILTLLSDLTEKEWVTFDMVAGSDGASIARVTGQEVYYGPSVSVPDTVEGLQGLSSVVYTYPFEIGFETGTAYTNFIIAIAQGQEIDTVTDTDAAAGTNDVTDRFMLRGDVDGYKVFAYTTAVPYAESHTFKFTLK